MKFNPYLNFPGTAEDAFNFYKSVFGGDFLMVQRFKNMPDADKLPPGVAQMIMHISLPLNNDTILMGSDAPAQMGFKVIAGNNNYISVSPDSREQADMLFNGLSAGGQVEMPIADTFWGAYFGSFTDKFGTKWMINFQQS
ncbi:VOC family protein [Panacibacter sp. DH6]|uniref:VOC family protein n=1 Tax=Panacibacter microcysteis TaxID=2793269 RepID=A0A931EBV7_9BACT|nr:VOC family protein [Panacibacter microcysteis]MBG9377851.1 VOC family protein [Panacibacter microcysteis]